MQAYVKDVNKSISRKLPRVRFVLADTIYKIMHSSPEMESVRAGTLKFDFGLDRDVTFEICSSISRSVSIEFSNFKFQNNRIIGNAQVNIQPVDYLNLLELPESVVITEDGVELPWLEWLLTLGDSVIVANYGVKYTSGGRSGGAVMTPDNKPFRVDPRYSGTVNDNFIARALNAHSKLIEDKIWQTILS